MTSSQILDKSKQRLNLQHFFFNIKYGSYIGRGRVLCTFLDTQASAASVKVVQSGLTDRLTSFYAKTLAYGDIDSSGGGSTAS